MSSFPDPIRRRKSHFALVLFAFLPAAGIAALWAFAAVESGHEIGSPAAPNHAPGALPQSIRSALDTAAFDDRLWYVEPPVIVVKKEPAVRANRTAPPLRLLAISVAEADRSATFYCDAQDQIVVAKIGETIGDFTLDVVDGQHVVLIGRDTHRHTLTLDLGSASR